MMADRFKSFVTGRPPNSWLRIAGSNAPHAVVKSMTDSAQMVGSFCNSVLQLVEPVACATGDPTSLIDQDCDCNGRASSEQVQGLGRDWEKVGHEDVGRPPPQQRTLICLALIRVDGVAQAIRLNSPGPRSGKLKLTPNDVPGKAK